MSENIVREGGNATIRELEETIKKKDAKINGLESELAVFKSTPLKRAQWNKATGFFRDPVENQLLCSKCKVNDKVSYLVEDECSLRCNACGFSCDDPRKKEQIRRMAESAGSTSGHCI